MPSAKAKKAYRARKKASGHCWTCGRPAEKGRKRCRPCLDSASATQRACHARKKEAGLCVRCAMPRGEDGTINHCRPCAEKITAQKNAVKLACFDAYGGARCACCGETNIGFLTIDHIEGGGTKHRRKYNSQSMYQILRREGYPPGFRVLCWNCNSGRYHNGGVCPHEQERLNELRQPDRHEEEVRS